MMITAELALRIRERGLMLPEDREYTIGRLKDIARRMHALMREMTELDIEIIHLVEEEESFKRSGPYHD